jgi:hypothetical protein
MCGWAAPSSAVGHERRKCGVALSRGFLVILLRQDIIYSRQLRPTPGTENKINPKTQKIANAKDLTIFYCLFSRIVAIYRLGHNFFLARFVL